MRDIFSKNIYCVIIAFVMISLLCSPQEVREHCCLSPESLLEHEKISFPQGTGIDVLWEMMETNLSARRHTLEYVQNYKKTLYLHVSEWADCHWQRKIEIMKSALGEDFQKAIGYEGLSDESYPVWLVWYMDQVLKVKVAELSQETQTQGDPVTPGVISVVRNWQTHKATTASSLPNIRKRLAPSLGIVEPQTWIEELWARLKNTYHIKEEVIAGYQQAWEKINPGWAGLSWQEKITHLKNIFGEDFQKAIGYEDLSDEAYPAWLVWYMDQVLGIGNEELSHETKRKGDQVSTGTISIVRNWRTRKKTTTYSLSNIRQRLAPALGLCEVKSWIEELWARLKNTYHIEEAVMKGYQEAGEKILPGWSGLSWQTKIAQLKKLFGEDFQKAIGYEDLSDEAYPNWLVWYMDQVLKVKVTELSQETKRKGDRVSPATISVVRNWQTQKEPTTIFLPNIRQRLAPALGLCEVKSWIEELWARLKDTYHIEEGVIQDYQAAWEEIRPGWAGLSWQQKITHLKNIFGEDFQKAIGYEDLSDEAYPNWLVWYMDQVLKVKVTELSQETKRKGDRVSTGTISAVRNWRTRKKNPTYSLPNIRQRLVPVLGMGETKAWIEELWARLKNTYHIEEGVIQDYQAAWEEIRPGWAGLSWQTKIAQLKNLFGEDFQKAIGYEGLLDEAYPAWLVWYMDQVLKVKVAEFSHETKRKGDRVSPGTISELRNWQTRKTTATISLPNMRKRLEKVLLAEAGPRPYSLLIAPEYEPSVLGTLSSLEQDSNVLIDETYNESPLREEADTVLSSIPELDPLHQIEVITPASSLPDISHTQAVIFDLDDTLVCPAQYAGSGAWEEAMRKAGIDAARIYREKTLHGRYQIPSGMYKPVRTDLIEYLKMLQAHNIAVYVVTGRSSSREVNSLLEHTGLSVLSSASVFCMGSRAEKIHKMQQIIHAFGPGEVMCWDNDLYVIDQLRSYGAINTRYVLMHATEAVKIPAVSSTNPRDLIDLCQLQWLGAIQLQEQELIGISAAARGLLASYRLHKNPDAAECALRGSLYYSVVQAVAQSVYHAGHDKVSRALLSELGQLLFSSPSVAVIEEFIQKYQQGILVFEPETDPQAQSRGRSYLLKETRHNESFFSKHLIAECMKADAVCIPLRGAAVYGWLIERVKRELGAQGPAVYEIPLSVKNSGDGAFDVMQEFLRRKIDVRNKTIALIDDNISQGVTMEILIWVLKRLGARRIIVASPMAYKDVDLYEFGEGVSVHVLLSPEGSYWMRGVGDDPWRPPVCIQTEWEDASHLTGYEKQRTYLGDLKKLQDTALLGEQQEFQHTVVNQFMKDTGREYFSQASGPPAASLPVFPQETFQVPGSVPAEGGIPFRTQFPYAIEEVHDAGLWQTLWEQGWLGTSTGAESLWRKNHTYVVRDQGMIVAVLTGRTVSRGVVVLEHINVLNGPTQEEESIFMNKIMQGLVAESATLVLVHGEHYRVSESRMVRRYLLDISSAATVGTCIGTCVKIHGKDGLEDGQYYGIAAAGRYKDLLNKSIPGYEQHAMVGVAMLSQLGAQISPIQQAIFARVQTRSVDAGLLVRQQIQEYMDMMDQGIFRQWPGWFFSEKEVGLIRSQEAVRAFILRGDIRWDPVEGFHQEDLTKARIQTPLRYLMEHEHITTLQACSALLSRVAGFPETLEANTQLVGVRGIDELVLKKDDVYYGLVTHTVYPVAEACLAQLFCSHAASSLQISRGYSLEISCSIQEGTVLYRGSSLGTLREELRAVLPSGEYTFRLVFDPNLGMIAQDRSGQLSVSMFQGRLIQGRDIDQVRLAGYMCRKEQGVWPQDCADTVSCAIEEDEGMIYAMMGNQRFRVCPVLSGITIPSTLLIHNTGQIQCLPDTDPYYAKLLSQYVLDAKRGIYNRGAYVWAEGIWQARMVPAEELIIPELVVGKAGLGLLEAGGGNSLLLLAGFKTFCGNEGFQVSCVASQQDEKVYVVVEDLAKTHRTYGVFSEGPQGHGIIQQQDDQSVITARELTQVRNFCVEKYKDIFQLALDKRVMEDLLHRLAVQCLPLTESALAIDWAVEELLVRYWHPTIQPNAINWDGVLAQNLREFEGIYYEGLDQVYRAHNYSWDAVEHYLTQIQDMRMREYLAKRIQAGRGWCESLRGIVKADTHLMLYQALSIDRIQSIWAAHRGAELALATGAGKTLTSLAAIISHMVHGRTLPGEKIQSEWSVLVSAKNSALQSVWAKTLEQFFPGIKAPERDQTAYTLVLPDGAIVRIYLVNHHHENLKAFQKPVDYLILDESHLFVGLESNRYQEIMRLLGENPGAQVLLLSATQYQGHHIERYAGQWSMVDGAKNLTQMKEALAKVATSREKTGGWVYTHLTREYSVVYTKESLPLSYFPQVQESDVSLDLTSEVHDAYQEVAQERSSYSAMIHELYEINEIYDKNKSGWLTQFMHQGDPLHPGAQDKVIVYSSYVRVAKMLEDQLTPFGSLLITGGMDPGEIAEILEEFSENPNRHVLIITPIGMESLDIGCGTALVVHDPPASRLEQLLGRFVRLRVNGNQNGHSKVVSYLLKYQDTLEDRIYARLHEQMHEVRAYLKGTRAQSVCA